MAELNKEEDLSIRSMEIDLIKKAGKAAGGDKSVMCHSLGIVRKTLDKKIELYDLTDEMKQYE